ncbi:hypothetical protein GUJ93_ZPchr0001g32082 [Zizania palustris]|uniref:BEACH domain-containing protein n=1 Tax=Zizania palustris TaxID=103762 RepID=A0A8J5REM0_ZIZPA|nr:hypothetical protein GUJ93_ZPchr0001g32082 [Zizania palustris]
MVCSPENAPEAATACPECLERRILSDLPGSCFSFVHGLSESPLPFASSAVVQIVSDGAEECNGSLQTSGYFVLVGLHGGKAFSYIQECETNSLENGSLLDLQRKESIHADDNQYTVQADFPCDSLWPYLSISDICCVKHNCGFTESTCPAVSVCCFEEDCSSRAIYSGLSLTSSLDWQFHFKRWWMGELSNYEYILVLNKLAGRRWGDPSFHTVMPWVIDFTVRPDENSDVGWRDLSKSKWRLAKGDEQLDFTYSSSEVPHHVSDECLSELAVCSYKARRLPKNILRSAVRSVYEPNEYPSNMQRLYQWTPDECIPEFYSDPRIFVSLHSEMSNLALPFWVTSAEEFICLHRDALESDQVSQQLHHWIDITFGYKLSGEASVEAKNVMLPPGDPGKPKSTGRHQLFTKPHPKRLISTPHSTYHNKMEFCARCQREASSLTANVLLNGHVPPTLSSQIDYLEEFEQANLFVELEHHLCPIYNYADNSACCSSVKCRKIPCSNQAVLQPESVLSVAPDFDFGSFLECFESDDSSPMGYQELLRWKQMSCSVSEHHANDIFSIGCMLAEIYLHKPLFDADLLSAYKETGKLPGAIQELPIHVAVLVESCIQREWRKRPLAKHLLESQYFPPSVRSAYMFLAPLQLLCTSRDRLKYVAKLASEGTLKAMGEFAAEMCAPYCLPLISPTLSDVDTEFALALLKEFVKCLSVQATKDLILHIIQKILQAPEYSHLKVSLLQDSFVRELWKKMGKQTYIEKVHPLVIMNLYNSPNKITASAASVVLIGSSEELGIPITVNQTVLPLIQCFGKGLCADGIDTLVRIGGLLGESFTVKQILPLLRNIILSCIDSSKMNKPEPQHSWNSFALMDSLSTLEGLVSVLPVKTVLRELLQDQVCLHIKVLTQAHLNLRVIQVAASALVVLCQRIGQENTAIYVLPYLKELFAELAFFHESSGLSVPTKGIKCFDGNEPIKMESRFDLVFTLYPFLAALIGIEKLREYFSTWFLLEQILQRLYGWKWEHFSSCPVSTETENMKGQKFHPGNYTSSEPVPTELAEVAKNDWNMAVSNQGSRLEHGASSDNLCASTSGNQPWFWFPSPDHSSWAPDFLGRSGGVKDDLPWKIKASILYSARAHPGALRSLAVHEDECIIFTGGVGPGFKGSIQRWELPSMSCTSGYYGHEEVTRVLTPRSLVAQQRASLAIVIVGGGSTRGALGLGRRPRRCWVDGGPAILFPGGAAADMGLGCRPCRFRVDGGPAIPLPGRRGSGSGLGSLSLSLSGRRQPFHLLPWRRDSRSGLAVLIVAGSTTTQPSPSLAARRRSRALPPSVPAVRRRLRALPPFVPAVRRRIWALSPSSPLAAQRRLRALPPSVLAAQRRIRSQVIGPVAVGSSVPAFLAVRQGTPLVHLFAVCLAGVPTPAVLALLRRVRRNTGGRKFLASRRGPNGNLQCC